MARKAEWEKLKERSLKNFGEESIFGEGSLNSRLALVGEAPGKHEVEEGRPFVGNAGKLLDERERRERGEPSAASGRDQEGRWSCKGGARTSQTPRPGTARQHASKGPDKEVVHPKVRARHLIRHRVRDASFSNLPSRIPAPP